MKQYKTLLTEILVGHAWVTHVFDNKTDKLININQPIIHYITHLLLTDH
jgi:hypothetical protein